MGSLVSAMTLVKKAALLLFAFLSALEGARAFQSSILEKEVQWLAREQSLQQDYYLPTKVDANSTCGRALQAMAEALSEINTTSLWAARMVDSWGKSNDGILVGQFYYEGAYDQCLAVASPEGFRGKYCRMTVRKDDQKPKVIPLAPGIPILPETRFIPGGVDSIDPGQEFSYSTCIPSVCTEDELAESLAETYRKQNSSLGYLICREEDQKLDMDASVIAYIVLVSFIFAIMLVAAVLDIYIQKTGNKQLSKEKSLRILLAFSAYTNAKKLFHVNVERVPGNIYCLNAMRVLSMVWVIWAHQQTVFVLVPNYFSILEVISPLPYQIIANGYPSVDTFFFMSGLLVTYNLLKEVKRTGLFNPILFYVHRLIRLIPPMLMVAGLYMTITQYFITGPFSYYWQYWEKNCREYFWNDVIMTNNMLYVPSCMGQCWYVSVDVQLYLVAPLFILPLAYKESLGKVWLFFVTAMSVIIPGAIIYAYDLPPISLLGTESRYMELVYIKPWCRAGPWVVGIWLGYIFHKQGRRKAKLNTWIVVAGWTCSTLSALLVLFGMWSYNVIPAKAQYDVITQLSYGSLHRSVWAACLAWIVYACHNGYGGFVDSIMSHPVWQPLGRLTYTLYLVAMPLQYAIGYATRRPTTFSNISKIIETCGAVFISGIVAVLVSLAVESPILGLEKLLLRRPARPPRDTGNALPEGRSDGANKTNGTSPSVELGGYDNPSFAVRETKDALGTVRDIESEKL